MEREFFGLAGLDQQVSETSEDLQSVPELHLLHSSPNFDLTHNPPEVQTTEPPDTNTQTQGLVRINKSSKSSRKRIQAATGVVSIPKAQGKSLIDPERAATLLLQYLLEQNRPYSMQNIYDNLHGKIPKPLLLKLLASLSGDKKESEGASDDTAETRDCSDGISSKTLDVASSTNPLFCKEYGKFKIYMIKPTETVSNNCDSDLNLEQRDEEIQNQELVNEFKTLKAQQACQNPWLQKSPAERETMQIQLRQKLKGLKTKIEELEAAQAFENHEGYTSQSALDRVVQIRNLKVSINKVKTNWVKYKRMCDQILFVLSNATEMGIADLIEELELEQD